MNKQNARALQSASLWVVGAHFLTVVLHSVAHEVLKVRATPAQLAFIIPVIIVGPVVAGSVLLKRQRAGAALLLATMLGAFLFGLYYHFIADTIDHVNHVARLEPAFWSTTFRVTAQLLLAAESVGALVAGLSLAGRPRTFKSYAATRTSL